MMNPIRTVGVALALLLSGCEERAAQKPSEGGGRTGAPVKSTPSVEAGPPHVDAAGHPTNPELALAIARLSRDHSKENARSLYAAFLGGWLIVPQVSNVDAGGAPEVKVSSVATRLEVVVIRGPDGNDWLPAFTDVTRLNAGLQERSAYTAMSGKNVAASAIKMEEVEGVVLDLDERGGGRPIPRWALEALAKGEFPE